MALLWDRASRGAGAGLPGTGPRLGQHCPDIPQPLVGGCPVPGSQPAVPEQGRGPECMAGGELPGDSGPVPRGAWTDQQGSAARRKPIASPTCPKTRALGLLQAAGSGCAGRPRVTAGGRGVAPLTSSQVRTCRFVGARCLETAVWRGQRPCLPRGRLVSTRSDPLGLSGVSPAGGGLRLGTGGCLSGPLGAVPSLPHSRAGVSTHTCPALSPRAPW